MVNIRLGPVIGCITPSSIRVLLEFDDNVSVLITATAVINPEEQIGMVRQYYAKKPKAYTIEGLKERTEYVISFKTSNDVVEEENVKFTTSPIEDANEHKARVFTLSPFPQNVRMVVVSGNNQAFPSEKSLWNVIEDKVLHNVLRPMDGILHVGNQIYADEILEKAAACTDDSVVEEMFRSEYRKAWNQRSMRSLFRKSSNIMLPSELDFGRGDERVRGIARKVSNEYQKQLFTDDLQTSYNHVQKIGDHVGLVFIDQSVELDMETIRSYFTQDAILSDVKGLLIVSNEPIIFLAPQQEHIKDKLAHINTEGFGYGHKSEQRTALLEFLYEWKQSADNHEVLIVCGNSATVGGHTLLKKEQTEFSQFVTAPVHSALLLNSHVAEEFNINGSIGDFSYQHFDWVCGERNFGVVDIFQTGSVVRPTMDHFIIREKSSITRHGSEKGRWQIEENEKQKCFQS